MKFANKVFGGRLKAFREQAGLTQKTLAEAIEVETATVSRWESGEFMPEDEKFDLLCKHLGREAQEFFFPDFIWKQAINSIKPDQITFTEDSASFYGIAALLAKFANLSPFRQKLVLALVFEDKAFASGVPAKYVQSLGPLLES